MHDHCDNCFIPSFCKYVRRSANDSNCSLIVCPFGCGVRFHNCKLSDHQLICLENVTPCLNAQFGCGWVVKRKELHRHLWHCRAYTIECSAEWNRYPAYPSAQNQLKKLAHDLVPVSADDQLPLDFAFALSDQNKVVDSFHIPSKLRKLYRDVYTPGHPVLPLPFSTIFADRVIRRSPSTDATSVSESADCSVGNVKQIPGLAASVLGTITNCVKNNSVDSKLLPNDSVIPHCASQCYRPDCNNLANCSSVSDSDDEDDDQNTLQQRPKVDKFGPITCVLCQRSTKKTINNNCENNQDSSVQTTTSNVVDDHASNRNPVQVAHGLHLFLYPDFLGSSQPKPKSVYSFRCCKILQYAEYSDHYKNLHCDIVDSLDDWIIVRCPLFYLGCDFYAYRWSLNGNSDDDEFVYDQWQQTFAVSDRRVCVDKNLFDLLNLPLNILCRIASFLDPFTLNNLSLVCTTLREVARSQLRTKGVVEIVWQKYTNGEGKRKWQATTKRWFFSAAYQSFRNRRQKNSQLASHLKTCKFNVIEKRDKPWPMVGTNVS